MYRTFHEKQHHGGERHDGSTYDGTKCQTTTSTTNHHFRRGGEIELPGEPLDSKSRRRREEKVRSDCVSLFYLDIIRYYIHKVWYDTRNGMVPS